jgi:hypothetical protein
VDRRFHRLQIIHAAHWPAPEGAEIARYRVHYKDKDTATTYVRFGHQIHGGWRRLDMSISDPSEARIVWRGHNPIAERSGYAVVLYLMTWVNPRPDVPVVMLDLESTLTDSSVGIVAITAE